MRKPERIPVVLEAVRKAWEAHPDLRLCQLISNACFTKDVFYFEDYELLAALSGQQKRIEGAQT